MTLVGFDAAFHPRLLMMGDKVFGRRHNFLSSQTAEDLGDDGVLWRFVAWKEFAFVLALKKLASIPPVSGQYPRRARKRKLTRSY